MSIRIGIVTISDRASNGIYEDLSGPAIHRYLTTHLTSKWESVSVVVPDEQAQIETTLKHLVDEEKCCLVLSTGGTGPAPRDVTPEATEAVCDRLLPGFGEQMRSVSMNYVPTAILSRQTAGLRKGALIANLPGSPKAVSQCLDAIFPAIPYCIELAGGPRLEGTSVFRPKKSS